MFTPIICVLTHTLTYDDIGKGVKETHDIGFDHVEYYYEINYDQGQNKTDIKAVLDRSIGQKILESMSMFDDCDQTSETQTIESNNGLGLDVRAISTRPHDKEVEEKLCGQGHATPGMCIVMKGSITLFFIERGDYEDDLEEKEKIIKDKIKHSMSDHGDFVGEHPGIIQLKYLSKHAFYQLPDNAVDNPISDIDENPDFEFQQSDLPAKSEGSVKGGTHSWKFIAGFIPVLGVLSIVLTVLAVLKWKQAKASEPKVRFDRSTVANNAVV